jgi:hypothetical protein
MGTKTDATGNVTKAWDDDLNGGIYDPRDPRWGAQDTPAHQAAAAQAMENQIACDLSMGIVSHAVAKWPQGTFYVDNLLIAPGSSMEGVATSQGGTQLRSLYNNHQLMQAPHDSMTVTCSDGNSHTDTIFGTHVSHFKLIGCTTGGCSNAAGDTANYGVGGPGNVGLEMTSTGGVVEWVYATAFGGYGIRVDGQDAKAFHNTVYNDLGWYYFGGYKGSGESVASAEVNTTTTGTTGKVTLSWTAVTGATGYAVYRGTSAGAESALYFTGTNSFTDIGTAPASGTVTNVVSTTVAAPGTITPTPSTTGGTLAAGTYYYRVTTLGKDALTVDAGFQTGTWHGSMEFLGPDVMSDWTEAYGLADAPTIYTYHHLADVLTGGGDGHFDHIWAQLGQVGIAQPFGFGAGDQITNVRVDFTRDEGIWITDVDVHVRGGIIDASCIAANAVTINTGQDGLPAGICNQYFSHGLGSHLDDVDFLYNPGFGSSQATADIFLGSGGTSSYHNVNGTFQYAELNINSGANWEPHVSIFQFVTGPTPDMSGLYRVNPNDSAPITYTGFMNVQLAQDFYVYGGNANVTIQNNSFTHTCTGHDINMGSINGLLHFHFISPGSPTQPTWVAEDCDPLPTVASSETVAFSATPTFSTATRASIITLTANVTSFTLAAGADGQEKTLEFCQDATGGFTVAAPSNLHGFFSVGTTANKCSSQHFTYAAGQFAWLADSPGVVNE